MSLYLWKNCQAKDVHSEECMKTTPWSIPTNQTKITFPKKKKKLEAQLSGKEISKLHYFL